MPAVPETRHSTISIDSYLTENAAVKSNSPSPVKSGGPPVAVWDQPLFLIVNCMPAFGGEFNWSHQHATHLCWILKIPSL